jgi:hypothetical protein
MGKKSRKKRLKKKYHSNPHLPIFTQMDEEGLHALVPGLPPSEEKLEEMSKIYQERIRHSPLWDEMVNRFGKNEAEELLKEFRVKIGE